MVVISFITTSSGVSIYAVIPCSALCRYPSNVQKQILSLKVHKHEIFLNFFFTKIESLYALGKFSKKILLSFLRFSPEFRSSNIYAVTEHTRNQIFLRGIQKNFFFQNLLYGPIRWVPRRFFQILIFYSRNLHFN